MDDRGNLVDMSAHTDEEAMAFIKKGFRPVKDEHLGQAGMILKGAATGKVDPAVFKAWTGKRQRRWLKKRMAGER